MSTLYAFIAFANISLSTYYCEISKGEPKAKEHIELRWLLPEELDTVKWAPADYPTLDILKNKN